MKHRLVIEVAFKFGEVVYLRCDDENSPGIVTGWVLRGDNPNAGILYEVAWGDRLETKHYAIELSREKSIDGCPVSEVEVEA